MRTKQGKLATKKYNIDEDLRTNRFFVVLTLLGAALSLSFVLLNSVLSHGTRRFIKILDFDYLFLSVTDTLSVVSLSVLTLIFVMGGYYVYLAMVGYMSSLTTQGREKNTALIDKVYDNLVRISIFLSALSFALSTLLINIYSDTSNLPKLFYALILIVTYVILYLRVRKKNHFKLDRTSRRIILVVWFLLVLFIYGSADSIIKSKYSPRLIVDMEENGEILILQENYNPELFNLSVKVNDEMIIRQYEYNDMRWISSGSSIEVIENAALDSDKDEKKYAIKVISVEDDIYKRKATLDLKELNLNEQSKYYIQIESKISKGLGEKQHTYVVEFFIENEIFRFSDDEVNIQ